MSNSSQEVRFKHGNYNRYYGYRNSNSEMDKRVPLLKREWFLNKCCLDVGCNVGHLTLWLAKHFQPKKMKGVDIDSELIKAARSNVVHYIDTNVSSSTDSVKKCSKSDTTSNEQVGSSENSPVHQPESEDVLEPKTITTTTIKITTATATTTTGECVAEPTESKNQHEKESNFKKPNSKESAKKNDVKLVYENDATEHNDAPKFPYNVSFVTENFVPSSATILKYTKQEYDIILCLSVTKWIQLNSGDEGLKLMFQKIYKLLNPGGIFILEPQPFKSYKRKKNLTPEIRKNYNAIKLLPSQYIDYLLSEEVGFAKCEELDVSKHDKQGFQRPLYLLMKK